MHYLENKDTAIKGITVTKDGERTFTAMISIDIHHNTKNPHTDTLQFVYIDALLAGCGTFTRDTFLDAVNLLGASINVTVQNDILTFSLMSLDTHRVKLLSLFTMMLQKPTFNPKELKRISVQLKNELIEEKEDAKQKSVHQLINTMYDKKDRRYVASEDALIAELSTITKAELIAFHTHVLSHKWVYTLTGTPKDALKTVEHLVSLRKSFKELEEFQKTVAPLTLQKNIVALTSIPSKQNIEINIGAPLPLTFADAEYYAFLFGLNVLGKWGGFAGRLMSTVREKEGLTYGIYAKTETTTLVTPGYWRIMTFFAPEKVMQGLTSTLREIELIRSKGITQNEYERFKTIINTQESLLQDSLLQQVSHLHSLQLRGLDYSEIQERKEKMLAVTRTEVNAALKKYLNISKLVISAAGPILSKQKELRTLDNVAKTTK